MFIAASLDGYLAHPDGSLDWLDVARLDDDLTISVMPILLGAGIPLFAPRVAEQSFVLDALRSWPTGVVQMRYSRLPKSP